MSVDATEKSSSVEEMIARVRSGSVESLGDLLQVYQSYLGVLATTQIDGRLRRRMSASDLVQETMLAAHRDFHQFRGGSEGELVAWLRQVLSNCLSHAVERNIYAKKRDIRREVALDTMAKKLDDSMARLSHLVADNGASPSEVVQHRELATELSDQLAKLKDSYRDVIVYRNLQGLSFDEIAQRMEIKSGAARMLWLRAIAKFKDVCQLNEQGDLS
ncbi:sigma-70 family RNA polymerase sigma factor [Rubripirellula amarantea]|uniref:ECF RNA polymerase sigma factor SigH n=1 Tax=Rubripirellula amarantea TaxID=2527999 RepID=A0A5C5WSA9_9BACT|nr:sigma-70 family RNA polymerase sigma factor [Rubripirellula amarantea]MDA8745513.1 sigma-70 family RNA polymerase sigma factor [Rubripirellula amarantea]TWT53686.1 ECF RNA polymerase sigma factor SigH [Rubripirellula amarantea]